MNKTKYCKFCGSILQNPFLDLGIQPLCNNNIKFSRASITEKKYPLQVYFCSSCFLVQLAHNINPNDIFNDYTYLSSYSQTWLNHAKEYSKNIIKKYKLSKHSFVVEIASNDGYLLRNFLSKEIPALGIEPAENALIEANKIGINTLPKYFTYNLSNTIKQNYGSADLIITNNVYAHVPEINDFTKGIKNLLKDTGIWTIEFPYLRNLIELNQFDTIYHEHYFYFSILAVNNILKKHNFKIIEIEKLTTHGGSLRLHVTHQENPNYFESDDVYNYLNEEKKIGIMSPKYYKHFKDKVERIKENLKNTLNEIKKSGKSIIGYGAPGKGNTLLNYCDITAKQISFTVDKNPLKQNTFLPGSRIPVYTIDKIKEFKPDYILILPWNIKDEIIRQIDYIKSWNSKIIIPIPEVKII